jgi:hypothetical protein
MIEVVPDHWFKAEVSFACPHCGQQSREPIIANAPRHDPNMVARGIQNGVAPLTCFLCKKVAPAGIRIDIGMNDLQPADVAKLNLRGPETPYFDPAKPCPCGLRGKKYGECCKNDGELSMGNVMLRGTSPITLPGARVSIQSSTVMGDTRFRILWNKVWHYPQIQTFHQFLDAVAVHTLGQDWFEAQAKLPLKNQSAIYKWRQAMMGLLGKSGDKDDDVHTAHTLTGEAQAYQCFAYDLYWLQLTHRLPDGLVKRLKDFSAFQGARYELLIAAVFTRAGFDIEWIDDEKASGKHPEFIATHRRTGKKIGVETKSRRRPGAMNYIGTVSLETHLKGDVFDLYDKAVQQAPGDDVPFLIFIDSNVPDSMPKDAPGYSSVEVETFPWMTEIRDQLTERWNANPEPTAESAVVVTNFAFYYGDDSQPAPIGMFGIFPSTHPKTPIADAQMIEDLHYCLLFYSSVPRQI